MVLACEDNKGRESPASRADALDDRSPLPIAWLDLFRSTTSLRPSNYSPSRNYAYYKPSFVKVIRVFVRNTVLCLCIPYKVKPRLNCYWILAFRARVIVLAIELDF